MITHLLCVDPSKRYTIDDFLAHPWIQEPAIASKTVPTPSGAAVPPSPSMPAIPSSVYQMPLDSPLLQAAHGFGFREGRSPGINTLKEAFDITYAVHRMEEEGAMRRNIGGGGGGGGGGRGFRGGLNAVDEDFEEDSDATIAGMNVKYGPEKARAFEAEAGRRIRERQQGQGQGQGQGLVQGLQQQRAGGGGANQHLARVLYDGRAGFRDQPASSSTASGSGSGSGRKKGPTNFDLDLHRATLLGRRHNRPSGGGTVEPSPLRQQAVPVHANAPASNANTMTTSQVRARAQDADAIEAGTYTPDPVFALSTVPQTIHNEDKKEESAMDID